MVRKGTLTPELTFTLNMTKIKRIQYSVTDAELELDRIAVSTGDKVKKGDLLVSFISEELENTLKEYKEKKEQNDLLIKHYKNLQKADKEAGSDTIIYKRNGTEDQEKQDLCEKGWHHH